MSAPAYRIDPSTPKADVDGQGRRTHRHTAANHVYYSGEAAEVTLCGVVVVYATDMGEVPDAPCCTTCERLDG